MARYFFHFRRASRLERDITGKEFISIKQAVTEADLSGRKLVAERVLAGEMIGDDQFEIADAWGNVLLVLPLKEIIR